jgi:hypothetical protein
LLLEGMPVLVRRIPFLVGLWIVLVCVVCGIAVAPHASAGSAGDSGVTIEGPPPFSDSDTALFTFSSLVEDATYECELDGGSPEPCTANWELSNLEEGPHEIYVRAYSNGEQVGWGIHRWTVDTQRPLMTHPFLELIGGVLSPGKANIWVAAGYEQEANPDREIIEVRYASSANWYRLDVDDFNFTRVRRNTPFRLRAKAIDAAGNRSEWSYGRPFIVESIDESDNEFSLSNDWKKVSLEGAMEDAVWNPTSLGARVNLNFKALGMSIVLPSGDYNPGAAGVYLNDRFKSRLEVDWWPTEPLASVYAFNWSTARERHLQIRAAGSEENPGLLIDGFLLLRRVRLS